MSVRRAVWGLMLVCTAGLAHAEAPKRSLLPQPRPQLTVVSTPVPAVRPAARPTARPQELAAQPSKPRATRKGSVCNNANIKGTALQPIASRTGGCNVAEPVQVTSINGVRLSPAPTINCDAAQALAIWIDQGLQPAFQNQVVQMNIADSYSCRPRNNVRGNKVSEHGLGNAIDIGGFALKSGKTVTVAVNFGRQIRAAHKAACGPFRTTLGPGSDGYHEDHIHFDVSKRGGNPYCR